jgi:hypothetical protein
MEGEIWTGHADHPVG